MCTNLCSRIPYYRLPRVLRDHPELREVGQITLLQSFRCVRLVLWDETQCRLVSFGDIKARGFRNGTKPHHRHSGRAFLDPDSATVGASECLGKGIRCRLLRPKAKSAVI